MKSVKINITLLGTNFGDIMTQSQDGVMEINTQEEKQCESDSYSTQESDSYSKQESDSYRTQESDSYSTQESEPSEIGGE